MWYIAWVSRLTGHEGRGSAMFDNREDAQRMCDRMNIEYPNILHWIIESK